MSRNGLGVPYFVQGIGVGTDFVHFRTVPIPTMLLCRMLFNGKGLGRDEVGMKEAIKVKLKFDTAGVGHNVADEHTYHWWDHAFNKAANNIRVQDSGNEVSVKCEEELHLSTKKPLSKGLSAKDLLYGRFIKSGLLSDGIGEKEVKSESESESEEEDNLVLSTSQHTDEQLFKLCGGLTAHKGARHGLKASGKLSRIEEQEAAFLAKWAPEINEVKSKERSKRKKETEVVSNEESGEPAAKKKKKKKSKSREKNDQEPSSENTSDTNVTNDSTLVDQCLGEGKKKKKKSKSKENIEMVCTEVNEDELSETELPKKTKKRKNKDKKHPVELDEMAIEDTETVTKKKKKKKSKDRDVYDTTVNDTVENETESPSADDEPSGKKSKKKKSKK